MAQTDSGPFAVLETPEAGSAPLYVLRFDADGACASPRHRAEVLERLAQGGHTDVYLFSHGWNNDFAEATARYRELATVYSKLRRDNRLRLSRPYAPLLVGVTWPSTSLLFPWEQGPKIAGVATAAPEDARTLDEVCGGLPESSRARVRELASRDRIDGKETAELAALIEPLYDAATDEEKGTTSAGELAALWGRALDERDEEGDRPFGTADADAQAPAVAGLLSALDPRKILRLATVRMMKDRAGHVGAGGVAPLLREILSSCDARVHLVGHSYGARVVLSATCAVAHPRQVDSVLLLQPAINRLCFAPNATADRAPGGYRAALTRVRQPIVTTFSKNDFPLRRVFHLALRRRVDLGEADIAAGAPPPFGALGGYGPGGIDDVRVVVPMKLAPERYAQGGTARVVALDGARTISGHGDVCNAATAWALFNQVAAS